MILFEPYINARVITQQATSPQKHRQMRTECGCGLISAHHTIKDKNHNCNQITKTHEEGQCVQTQEP
jgi:hypothetical protein